MTRKKTPAVPADVVFTVVENQHSVSMLHLEAVNEKIEKLKADLAAEEARAASLREDLEAMGAFLAADEKKAA